VLTRFRSRNRAVKIPIHRVFFYTLSCWCSYNNSGPMRHCKKLHRELLYGSTSPNADVASRRTGPIMLRAQILNVGPFLSFANVVNSALVKGQPRTSIEVLCCPSQILLKKECTGMLRCRTRRTHTQRTCALFTHTRPNAAGMFQYGDQTSVRHRSTPAISVSMARSPCVYVSMRVHIYVFIYT
jgi:hypothetical protein